MSQLDEVQAMTPSSVRCDGCGSADQVLQAYCLCEQCLRANTERLSAVKARFGEPVDWDDVKKYGLYDRHGRPIATVLSVDRLGIGQFKSGGSIWATTSTINHAGEETRVVIEAKELFP